VDATHSRLEPLVGSALRLGETGCRLDRQQASDELASPGDDDLGALLDTLKMV